MSETPDHTWVIKKFGTWFLQTPQTPKPQVMLATLVPLVYATACSALIRTVKAVRWLLKRARQLGWSERAPTLFSGLWKQGGTKVQRVLVGLGGKSQALLCHFHSLGSASTRTGPVGLGGWAVWRLGAQGNKRPRLARAGRVAPIRREHLPPVKLESAPRSGFPPLSRIFITDPNSPVVFTISVRCISRCRIECWYLLFFFRCWYYSLYEHFTTYEKASGTHKRACWAGCRTLFYYSFFIAAWENFSFWVLARHGALLEWQ